MKSTSAVHLLKSCNARTRLLAGKGPCCVVTLAVRPDVLSALSGRIKSVTWARDIRGVCRHKLIAVGRVKSLTLSLSFAASLR
jgi:hypothetical protein